MTVLIFLLVAGSANACLSDFQAYKDSDLYGKIGIECRKSDWLFPDARKLIQSIFGGGETQIAVIAGVSSYKNLGGGSEIKQVHNDVVTLRQILWEKFLYDEVIVLENEGFSKSSLDLVFTGYLPSVLSANNKSRVLFTFSGHGAEFENEGYIFFPPTKSININQIADARDAIDFVYLKGILNATIKRSHQFLALINSCNGGHFLTHAQYLGPAGSQLDSGAWGITAGRAHEQVGIQELILGGEHTVFFDLVIRALQGGPIKVGETDFPDPAGGTGVLDVGALGEFLKKASPVAEGGKAQSDYGVLGTARGQFFFVTDPKAATPYFAERVTAVKALLPGLKKFAAVEDGSYELAFDLSAVTPLGTHDDWVFKRTSFRNEEVCLIETTGNQFLRKRITESTRLRELKEYDSGSSTRLRLIYYPTRRRADLYYLSRLAMKGLADQVGELRFGAEGFGLSFGIGYLLSVQTSSLGDESYVRLASIGFTPGNLENLALSSVKEGDRLNVEGLYPASVFEAWAGYSYAPEPGATDNQKAWQLSARAYSEIYEAYQTAVGRLLLEPITRYMLDFNELQTQNMFRQLTASIVRGWHDKYDLLPLEQFPSDGGERDNRVARVPEKVDANFLVDLSRFGPNDIDALENLQPSHYELLAGPMLGHIVVFRDELSLIGFSAAYSEMADKCGVAKFP
ncbi:hypothetical protein [Rhizobium leguminosarum]